MKNLCKQILSLAVALVMVLSMFPAPAVSEAATTLSMYYDDRMDISALGGSAASTVSVTAQNVTSSDSAVVTYADGTLIATGIGTVTVTVDGNAYAISVTAAPITLLMITGHSIGAGQTGVAAQSVKNEAGQVYSTHGTALAGAATDGVGLGYAASSRPDGIDALVSGGTIGEAGGLAYQWNQLTGEKIWVLNTAVGGTSLRKWEKGTTAYNNAVNVFKYAQGVLANEVAAGHYILKNEAIIYHSAANWGWSDNGTWNNADGEGWYASMLGGFRSDLGVDAIGLVPIYTQSSAGKYNNDVAANYFMGASSAYPDVFMASCATSDWVLDITSFPDINYTTQSEAVTKPTTVAGLFATDGVHLSQVAYNAGGMDIAKNLYTYLRGNNAATSVSFKTTSAGAVASETVMAVGDSISLVPHVSPLSASNLTFTVSKNLSITYPLTVTALSDGMGTLKVSQDGVTLATLNFAVGDTSVPVEPSFPDGWSVEYHCVCGNPNSTGNPCAEGGHTPVEWQPWTDTRTVPMLSGYWYLPNDLTLTNSNQYPYGTDFATSTGIIGREAVDGATALKGEVVNVYVDLNGKTVTGNSGHRIYRIENDLAHSLTICDTAGGGQLIAKSGTGNTNAGMLIWTRGASNNVTIYGGTFDATGATVTAQWAQGAGINNNGTMKIYGGTIIGGTVISTGYTSGGAQGGTIWNKKNLYIYGGTIQGGTTAGTTLAAQGGNIRNEGGANLYIYGGNIIGGTATTTGGTTQGGNVSNVGNFYMYGGTISGGTATDAGGGNGGSLFTTTGGIMEGGTIKGGVATTSNSSNGHYGGCVYIYGGNFQMKGGTIQAASPTSVCAYRGGAVYVAGSASAFFTMTGGTVIGGKVSDLGGGIGTQTNGTINIQGGTVTAAYYADGTPITDPADAQIDGAIRVSCAGAAVGTWGGTINISGGTVIGGQAGGAGGSAISVHGGTKLNISGGLITGGVGTSTDARYGGMISVYSSGSVLTMTGGTVTGTKDTKGGVFVRNGGAITVSGDAVISGNYHPTGSACNLNLSNVTGTAGSTTTHSMLTVGADGLGENAKIGVSMAVPGTFTTNTAPVDAFVADSGYYLAQNEDGTLSLTTHASRTHCVCGGTYDGCDHTDLEGEWIAWDGKSAISASGNYYLTQSVSSWQQWMGGTYTNTEEMTINLCLNGHSITSSGRVFGVAPNVTFHLMNCHEVESILSGSSSTGNPGRVIHLHAATSTMSMYSNITLQGMETNTSGATVVMDLGGVINCCGTFNMYGGKLIGTWVGGLVDNDGTYTVYPGLGGVARIPGNGRFNLYAGEVYGGSGGRNGENKVTDGANGKYTARSLGGVAYLTDNGQFNMYGGTVYGGSVGDGGVVYAIGANTRVNISGGTMYAGNAAFGGGAIKMSEGGVLTMTGGVIDGINPQRPRDIVHAGPAGGGAIMLWNSHAVIKGNAVIQNCYTSNLGGAIKVATGSSTLTLGGSVQLTANGKGDINAHTTDNVYLVSGATITLDGLTSAARVGIEMANPGVFVTEGATEDLVAVFQPNSSSFSTKYENGTLYLGGAPVVVGSKGYADLAAALAEASANDLVTLNEDQTVNVTVPVSIYLDLNSYDIAGDVTVADGAVLSLMDSATADYTAENRGLITGTLTGSVARSFNTPSSYGHNYKYLTICESDGSYSAHRIYLTVAATVLSPYLVEDGVISTALNYKTVFKCNDVVAEYVDGYGAKLTGDNTVYADHLAASAYTLATGADQRNEKVTALSGIMKSTNTAEQNTANAAAAPTVSAYITLNDGLEAEVVSVAVSQTLKEAISTVNACPTLTEKQQLSLGKMYEAFQESMDTWTDIYMGRIRICYAEKVLEQPIVADKTIALTFDDGPNLNNSMEDVMQILDMYDQKATFFLIGRLINENNEHVVLEAYQAGHELGNHSYSHTRLTDKTTEEAIADWQACQDAVEAITGEAPKLFRAPFLTYNDAIRAGVAAPFINGTSHGDYNAGVTAEDIAKSVITKAADGGIILLHVSEGYDWTEEALHTIIPELRSLGYEITTVSGLFEAKGVEPVNGTVYGSVEG